MAPAGLGAGIQTTALYAIFLDGELVGRIDYVAFANTQEERKKRFTSSPAWSSITRSMEAEKGIRIVAGTPRPDGISYVKRRKYPRRDYHPCEALLE
jgi:hypothetical protein